MVKLGADVLAAAARARTRRRDPRHLRLNELEVATIVFKSLGDPQRVLDYDTFLEANAKNHWLAREIRLKWKRVLKRVDLTSRSLVALIEPGSCFAGTLAELVFAADRSYMLIGRCRATTARPPRSCSATPMSPAYSR